jgi:hypothetical protein
MKYGYFVGLAVLLGITGTDVLRAAQASSESEKTGKTAKQRAIDFCRAESVVRLKYAKTVEWDDLAKEEKAGTWLISGIRTAVAPSGNIDQIYTCRVQTVNNGAQLKMIQIFKESSKTGKDIFEVR